MHTIKIVRVLLAAFIACAWIVTANAEGLGKESCLVPVSMDTKGELKVRKQESKTCGPGCITLKVRYRLGLAMTSNNTNECNNISDQPGELRANLNMATKNDGHGRGFHEGRFRWATSAGNVVGRMRGITNAGTHRRPPDDTPIDDCELCNVQGHMEGQLEGRIVDGPHKGCRVRASYVINYDPGVAGQDTGVWGTLESVFACKTCQLN